MFRRGGCLYSGLSRTLRKELVSSGVYNSLLRLIAYVKQKTTGILKEIGKEAEKMHIYLNVLLSIGILSRDI